MSKAFDSDDLLNEDGTVTITMSPSQWHHYNISPDTYSLFTTEHFENNEIQNASEVSGQDDLDYGDFDWEYDHPAIVRGISEALADTIVEKLMEIGLESAAATDVIDSWSPREYNFTSDGFEMRFTCDPEELRALTPDFFVEEWVHDHYRSSSGFLSYVPGRMQDDDWYAEYDGAFRIEYLLSREVDPDYDWWRWEVDEALTEIHVAHIDFSPYPDVLIESNHEPRIDKLDNTVTYEEGYGWTNDNEEFYETLLEYHRGFAKIAKVEKNVY